MTTYEGWTTPQIVKPHVICHACTMNRKIMNLKCSNFSRNIWQKSDRSWNVSSSCLKFGSFNWRSDIEYLDDWVCDGTSGDCTTDLHYRSNVKEDTKRENRVDLWSFSFSVYSPVHLHQKCPICIRDEFVRENSEEKSDDWSWNRDEINGW